MDALHIPPFISLWVHQYGSFALFGLLAIGIVALPVPEEALMVFAGILMRKGKLMLVPTVVAAFAGAMCGISLSYLIGKVGLRFLVKKEGDWPNLKAKIDKWHEWFQRYGKWTLFFGYFIPGVRHFTGLAAGVGKLKYTQFALFAYCGAITWASIFLSVGFFSSQYLDILYHLVAPHLDVVISLLIGVLIIYLWVKTMHGL